jgi:hypothetical protein
MEPAAFRQRVGQRLGIVPAAGTLSAEDGELIGNAYASLVAELIEHNLAAWYNPDSVPDAYTEVVSGMVAALLVDDFGVSEPRRSQLIATHAFGLPVASPGERRLRAMVRIESNDDSEPEFY